MKREELEKLLAATADAVPYVDPEWDEQAERLAAHWPAMRELWRACEERHTERRKGESIDAYIRRTSDRTSINAALAALEAVPRG